MQAGGAERSTFSGARRIFATALGGTFFVAFVSFEVQALGLIGARGIAPAAELLEQAQMASGSTAFIRLPTLLRLNASDAAIIAVGVAGCICAALMAVGFCPGICGLASWVLYLSLCSVGKPIPGLPMGCVTSGDRSPRRAHATMEVAS